MSLTWNEIRIRASQFSKEWAGETYEKGESQSFYNDFFEIFGVKRRSVARFERHIKRLGRYSGYIDVFWPGILIAEHKSRGVNLEDAANQADDYHDALEEHERPRFRLVCDFEKFELFDLETQRSSAFRIEQLVDHVEEFAFIIGKQRPTHRIRPPLNLKAARYVAGLLESLLASGYQRDQAEKLLVRLVFCMFADVTGIFQPRGVFLDLLESKSNVDGSDLGYVLGLLFQVLNTPHGQRQATLDEDFKVFPYVNGDLFSAKLDIASSDGALRDRLLEAATFDWSTISPAIFGAMFQGVLSKEEQKVLGSYATSELYIKRILDDLFLNDWKARLERVCHAGPLAGQLLRAFREELSRVKFLDPCCGCGNFLAVAYREVRRFELEIIKALRDRGLFDAAIDSVSVVDVDQFFGFEIRASSAKIAEIAMWMTDHLMNTHSGIELGVPFARIPLKKCPTILVSDALAIKWADVLNPSECSFVVGNPPYKGAKLQTPPERNAIRHLRGDIGAGGTLDYSAGWLLKAVDYIGSNTKVAYVVTSSLTQGEQIGQLFPVLFSRREIAIDFAHQRFSWESCPGKKAQVEVVVIGLSLAKGLRRTRHLYSYPNDDSPPAVVECNEISPYLRPADRLRSPKLVVREVAHPINGAKALITGSKPIDGGYYILSAEERGELLQVDPEAQAYIRPFVGGTEHLYGDKRYIIYLGDDTELRFRRHPAIARAVAQVRRYRSGEIPGKNGRPPPKSRHPLADTPTQWHITTVPIHPFLIIPEVTSERRVYIPIAWEAPPAIPSNLVKVLEDASYSDFALLTSAMHMAWVRAVGGRLESRYRYSQGLIYNTFPRPIRDDFASLQKPARDVLAARAASGVKSLEAMYDPDHMPVTLLRAHRRLDAVVDRLYRPVPFVDEQDRFEHLMNMYFDMLERNARAN